MDESVCLCCLKKMDAADDLRVLLLDDQLLCLKCRRSLQRMAWHRRRCLQKQIRGLCKEAGSLCVFVLYEENEAFCQTLERFAQRKDVVMAPLFLDRQKKALQFLKDCDLWLMPADYQKLQQDGELPMQALLKAAGLSASFPLEITDSGVRRRPSWKPRSKKPGCLVLEKSSQTAELAEVLPLLQPPAQAVFLLAG